MTAATGNRYDGLLGADDSPAPRDFLLLLRRTLVPNWTTPGKRGRTISGSKIKECARIYAGYANYDTVGDALAGWGMHPTVGMIAEDMQVDYRTAADCVAALKAYRLIEMTEDARGHRAANGYRLLNPCFSGLEFRDPDQFKTAADANRLKAKGVSKPARNGPKLAQVIPIVGGTTPPHYPEVGGTTPPQVGGTTPPPPTTNPPPENTNQKSRAFVTTDRARAAPDEDPSMPAGETPRPRTSAQIRAAALARSRSTRPPGPPAESAT